ncbi:Dihydrodipicolinate reductase (DHPR) [Candidatus Magnetomorum sp. HK-1]|nr:Dihydrodipicolinate reductase (DHPR) [Candidatus Magnetomorum sp. HK-1]
MNSIKIMVNGLPGNMAQLVIEKAMDDQRFEVTPFSLTGPEIEETSVQIKNKKIALIKPDQKDSFLSGHDTLMTSTIAVDYTHPSAVDLNCQWYCENNLHFVIGTTGGNRKRINENVQNSEICAVVAPNMGKQIVGFQAMIEYAAKTFPGLFDGYTIEIRESHQLGKADSSGTARSLVPLFQDLGLSVQEKDIFMERNPKIQHKQLGVPKSFLGGHAWHTYSLTSKDQNVSFQFTHNVNGRSIYALGTLDAVQFLHHKILEGNNAGQVYTMIDVLKGL